MTKARGLADLGNAYDDGALSNRNMIINGAMRVNARGTQTGIGSNSYFVDRFQIVLTDEGSYTLSQADDAPSGSGFTKSAKLEITTADTSIAATDYAQMRYKFENQDVKHLMKGTANAKAITLSFWVKSSLAQDFKLRIRDNNSSTSRQTIKSYTIASANTWQKVIMTFDGDTGGDDFSGSANTSGNLILEWLLGGGANYQGGTASGTWEDIDDTKFDATDTFLTTVNSTLYVTGVQMEVGDTATPFEHKNVGQEILACQRYYWRWQGNSSDQTSLGTGFYNTTTNALIHLPHPVRMRAKPTGSTGSSTDIEIGVSGSNITGTVSEMITDDSEYSVLFQITTSSQTQGASCRARLKTGADAFIAYDAEL